MGQFLSLAAVIGKQGAEVTACLSRYANALRGTFNRDESLQSYDAAIVTEVNGNTAIVFPGDFYSWDECCEYLSKELSAAVFSCHIHDGDLWMYMLYYNGQIVDKFNPIPDYWDDSLAEHELEEWVGNAAIVASYVPGISAADIDKYLVRWDLKSEDISKAYPDDENPADEEQLYDFLRKLGVTLEVGDDGLPKGDKYLFKVKDDSIRAADMNIAPALRNDVEPSIDVKPQVIVLPEMQQKDSARLPESNTPKKPWWKLW